MKKVLLTALVFSLAIPGLRAQTKVFKEVGEEISSQIRTIEQDNALVGYVVFTQLEKASEDSFNYKITIMDENLNDIGTVSFREQTLSLQAASFEQDVLCLAYLKSNFIGKEFKNAKEYRAQLHNSENAVLMQFLSLDGKIIKSKSTPVEVDINEYPIGGSKVRATGKLKYPLQLRNLGQKGFVSFYGDDDKSNLFAYNLAGDQTWQKKITDDAEGFALLTSGHEAWLLLKKKATMVEGGFELLGYNIDDSSSYPKYYLKDKKGNSLKVLAFENDPASGRPYITGNIIHPDKGNAYYQPKGIAKGAYSGVFSLVFKGHQKGDIQELYSYWSDGSQSFMSKNGLYTESDSYAKFSRSFRDYQGNTYFAGSSFVKKTKWVAVGAAIVTAPLLLPPFFILATGTQKAKVTDALLLKQTAKGIITVENNIPANNSKYYTALLPLGYYDTRNFYTVVNSDTKTNYLIVDDVKDIIIYNVNQRKTVRTIPHKDGNIRTAVFPAKEGHVMVSEYNKKERYTRFSIESL